jgi:NADPH:quinone reductase-like Zn-dependent oxidoreductase
MFSSDTRWCSLSGSKICSTKLVDAGQLKPVVETVLPLSDARRAHELNETGHARGKTVLKVA